MILIGNKCELQDCQAVSKDSGLLLAEEYNIELFMETSALTNINIEEVSIIYHMIMFISSSNLFVKFNPLRTVRS